MTSEFSSNPILWSPNEQQIREANITHFAKQFGAKVGRDVSSSYRELHQASIEFAPLFWREVWEFSQLPGSLGEVDYKPGASMREGIWFPQGLVNFAECLLQPKRLSDKEFAESIAIIAGDESGESKCWTRKELFDQVRRMSRYLYSSGLRAGDRVAAVVPNTAETVIAMLASTALGAIWSSCSPEFGDDAICDRFSQIQPRILFAAANAVYNKKTLRPADRVVGLIGRLPTVERIIVVASDKRQLPNSASASVASSVFVVSWSEAMQQSSPQLSAAGRDTDGDFDQQFLKRLTFNHPLYIVYSSGTTGVPKCIVHGVGGTLLQHVKEHQLHCDLKPGDRLFYYTTTGWMMWNWLVSGLASGATVVLYDGSPFSDGPSTLWKVAEQNEVTHYGAGARFYAAVEKECYEPRLHHDLSKLRCLMSTGSPLLESSFDWIYQSVSRSINLASISGGTDILSCFVLGNPTLPVRRGEIQCKGLGMDVRVFNELGNSVVDQPGELVCASPFPSIPIQFWNDEEGQKYQRAYFDRFPNVWCHGDWSRETAEGGMVIYGRSDATLNPGGVRIGTAEIYQQIESFPQVQESLATVQKCDGDEQIVLFLRMAEGCALTADLVASIRGQIRSRCSPRHVPTYISAAPDLPRTISGKLSEIAVRNAISGTSLGNAGALANPTSLSFFEQWNPKDAL
ncbi:MAG: acetoacetate--CoA ligase [Pirellulales bacterium]